MFINSFFKKNFKIRHDSSEKIYYHAKAMFLNGDSAEEIIGLLKQKGISQSLSSLMLSQMGVDSSEECKKMILNSKHWSESLEVNLKLHEHIGNETND